MGSFYLVNLILAIVAMSYDDCQKKDQEEADEAEEAEEDAVFHRLSVCLSVRPSVTLSVFFYCCLCTSQPNNNRSYFAPR